MSADPSVEEYKPSLDEYSAVGFLRRVLDSPPQGAALRLQAKSLVKSEQMLVDGLNSLRDVNSPVELYKAIKKIAGVACDNSVQEMYLNSHYGGNNYHTQKMVVSNLPHIFEALEGAGVDRVFSFDLLLLEPILKAYLRVMAPHIKLTRVHTCACGKCKTERPHTEFAELKVDASDLSDAQRLRSEVAKLEWTERDCLILVPDMTAYRILDLETFPGKILFVGDLSYFVPFVSHDHQLAKEYRNEILHSYAGRERRGATLGSMRRPELLEVVETSHPGGFALCERATPVVETKEMLVGATGGRGRRVEVLTRRRDGLCWIEWRFCQAECNPEAGTYGLFGVWPPVAAHDGWFVFPLPFPEDADINAIIMVSFSSMWRQS